MEGQRYGLSSNTEGDKTIIHLKLTDSALKTLEEYAKQKDEQRKATIRFPQGSSGGSIQIPTRKGENNTRTFQFTLSSIQGDPNGSFDCLEQTNSRYRSQVNALGCMMQKIVVHANDDVYKTTKERMTLAEEENKKVCTKEIKPSGPFMRRMYKKVNKNNILPPKASSAISQSSWSSHGSYGNHHSSSGSLTSHNGVSSHNGSSAFSNNQSVPSPQTFPGFSQSANNGRRGPANEPLRDRVIHLLAVRPYNKPELILRLKKDGPVDKDLLGTLMEEVATQYKENKYTLAKRMYSEVQLDWPYYADGERQLVRRRIATDGRSASNSPEESSPHYSNNLPNSGSPYGVNNAQKRGSGADIQAAKKMRVSPPTIGERQHQNGVSLKKPVVKMPGQHQPPIITPNNNSVTHSHLMNGLSKSSDSTNNHFGNSQLSANFNAQSKNNLTAVTSKMEEVPSPSSSPDIDTLNYLSKYSVICGDSQRQEYKNDFNTEYFEYQKLYQEINKVSQKFLDWDNQMKNLNKGSPAYEKLERKIVNEYHQTKKDTKFIQTKNRFEFLHRKLGHIKKLVVDYDQKQMASLKS